MAAPRTDAATSPRPHQGARLALDGVSKHFARGTQGAVAAVRDVSLTVEPGELVTLLGPSGCGKTTTLRIVAGFERPDQGRVRVDEQDITDLAVHRRGIGFVFQNYALFPHLTVLENVAYGLRVQRLPEATIRDRTGRVLELVGLPGYERRFPHQISGGEQQRVAVARAVIVEPRLLLFDEPLSNLDATLRVQMRGELLRLQRELRITTIYVTHDQEEAMALSDRIAVMRGGRIVQAGSARELYAAPRSAFVARFIGRTSLLPSRVLRAGAGAVEVQAWADAVRVETAEAFAVGQRVLLVLRPEAVTLLPESAMPPPGHASTPGVVRASTFLGEKAEYLVEVAGGLVQAVDYDPLRRGLFDSGARVRVACAPSALFPLADDEAAD